MEDGAGYRPLRDYALVGDCHGAALVSREGGVDWCALGRFDADPVLCPILDARKGGVFRLKPLDLRDVSRRYIPRTNVLETTFRTDSGECTLTDFMPVGRVSGAGLHDYVSLRAPFWLVRLLEGRQGVCRIEARYRPVADFARRYPPLSAGPFGVEAQGGPFLATDIPLETRDNEASGLYERLLGHANDVGLFPEEIDYASGDFLGNYPQAYSHLGLILSAVHLDLVRRHGPDVLWTGYVERARLAAESTVGPRAIWAAFKKTRRLGRLFSSRRSVLP